MRTTLHGLTGTWLYPAPIRTRIGCVLFWMVDQCSNSHKTHHHQSYLYLTKNKARVTFPLMKFEIFMLTEIDTLHGPSRIGRHGSCQAGSVSVPSHDPIPSERRIFGSSICPDGPGTNYGLNPGFSTSVGASESHALPTILSLEIDRTKPDSCVICQRYSTQVEDLKLHQRSHRKDRPVKCPQCRRSFAHSDLLPRHQPHVHTLATPSSNTSDIMSNTNYSSVGQPDLNMESERDLCNPFHNLTSTAHSEFPSDSPHPAIAYSTSSLYHPIQSNPVTPSNQNWDETFE